MKISNSQAISFVNAVNEMKNKRLPIKLSFAIKTNFNLIVVNQIDIYNEELKRIKNLYLTENNRDESSYTKELSILLSEEVEHQIKKVKLEIFEMIDNNDAYDTLSLFELDAISFMIEEAE